MPPPVEASDPIVGRSPALMRAKALAHRFAATNLPILLVGATGTGKELFAQYIHRWSGRRGALVDIDCGALPGSLAENILFGHRRGAYTGATEATDGLIAAADGGTLFLDELSSLPIESQAKLLRVLETGEVRRMAETAKRSVRFRVVAAVQGDFDARLARGDFRLDLFARVAGVVLHLPALADRGDDPWFLARHFACIAGVALEPAAGAVVNAWYWPGNVRELKQAIERARFLAEGPVVTAAGLIEAILLRGTPAEDAETGAKMHAAVARHRELTALLTKYAGNAEAAARELRVSRSTLYEWLRRYAVTPQRRGRYRKIRNPEES